MAHGYFRNMELLIYIICLSLIIVLTLWYYLLLFFPIHVMIVYINMSYCLFYHSSSRTTVEVSDDFILPYLPM